MAHIKSFVIVAFFLCSIQLKAQPCPNSEQIVMVKGVECILPKLVSNGELLLPCVAPPDFNSLIEGDTAWIEYENNFCFSICLQGKEINILCFEKDKQTSLLDDNYKNQPKFVYSESQLIFNEPFHGEIVITNSVGSILLAKVMVGSILDLPFLPIGMYYITFIKTGNTTKFFKNN